MPNSLTYEEKAALLDIIKTIFGSDLGLSYRVTRFNQSTVEVLEEAIVALEKCNGAMKVLVVSLVGGIALLSKGWLRKSLKKLAKSVKDDDDNFNGIACRNATSLRWRRAIEIMLY